MEQFKLNAAARLRQTVLAADEASGSIELVFSHREPLQFRSASKYEAWEFSSKARALGAISHLRAGHYSIILFKDGDIGVAKAYKNMSHEDKEAQIPHNSEQWETFQKGRLSQLTKAASALQKSEHPLNNAVLHEIKAEEQHFTKE